MRAEHLTHGARYLLANLFTSTCVNCLNWTSAGEPGRTSTEALVGAMAGGQQQRPREEETYLRDAEEGSNLTDPTAKGGQTEAAAAAAPLPPPYTEIDLSAIQTQPGAPPPSYVVYPPPPHSACPAYPIESNQLAVELPAPGIYAAVVLRDVPAQVRCPKCQFFGWTTTHNTNGGFSWLLATLFCLFGFYFCCCLIPLLFPTFKDTQHHCSNCKAYIGTYRRM
uniref:Lipopolysaccharide-induced tumor necrosis factor-alpha factor homolog isoform X1 n=2 Tax=Petromyzon marinus TaxID=7757 RepID=A0AAJ7X0X1_PETMA|nr:lipopolysaccharide-induced tumor necrosis factor-alpha factor homolog isoform X1 [Petromyzon marinus]